jgi:hypothetical protein
VTKLHINPIRFGRDEDGFYWVGGVVLGVVALAMALVLVLVPAIRTDTAIGINLLTGALSVAMFNLVGT